ASEWAQTSPIKRGYSLCRRFLQKQGKITPEPECNKKLREQVHRANQHVNWIVKQGWPALFKKLVADNLRCCKHAAHAEIQKSCRIFATGKRRIFIPSGA